MMRKFELCFPLEDGNSDRFLIPDLLPKEEPATGDWESGLAFQYQLQLPPQQYHLPLYCTDAPQQRSPDLVA